MAICARLCLILIIGAIAVPAMAEIYKWVDKDGTIHFTDSPPEQVKKKKVDVQINSYTDPNAQPYQYNPALITQRKNSTDVVMYSTTWCGACKQARRYFNKKGISFREYDVEKSTKGKQDYRKLKGRGVPLILVGNQRMNGFSPAGFERMYKR